MAAVYEQIEILVRLHPGWTLTEIKNLSKREREHWLALGRYEAERRSSAL